MSLSRYSRYLRQDTIAVEDADGSVREVYEQRDTTVFEDDRPEGTRTITADPGSNFPSIARINLGTHRLWWMIADMNPEIFYPLDYTDGTELRVPPKESILRFQRKR